MPTSLAARVNSREQQSKKEPTHTDDWSVDIVENTIQLEEDTPKINKQAIITQVDTKEKQRITPTDIISALNTYDSKETMQMNQHGLVYIPAEQIINETALGGI